MANVKDLYAKISATADGFDKVMTGVENKTRDVAKSVGKQSSFMNKSLSGIGNVGKSFENISSKLQGVSKTTGDLGSKFNKSITKPAGVAVGAVGGLVGALGFKRLMGMDAAEAKLKGLGYAGKEVETIQGQVETAIQGSMTTMAEGTDIAAGGLAAGVEKGKDLEQYIKLVGDAAVGSGRPVDEMAQIFARVEGSGKVMTEELNMVEQGMPGFSKAMADDLGVPLDQFKEKVTAGEVSSEDFMTTMDSFAGKMSGEYAKSFEGMTKNTMAFVGQIGEKILGGAFEKSKKSLNEFLGWISSKEVQDGAARLGEKFGVAFNIIINAVSGAVKWFAGLPAPVQKAAGAFALLLVAVGPVLALFSKITGVIAGIFGPFGKFLGMVSKMGPLMSVLTGPVGWIIGAIVALGAAFFIAYKKSESFRNFINGIGKMISGAIGWVKQFGTAIGALFGGDQKEGTSILKKLGFNEEQIATLQDMVGRIKSMFTTMGSAIATVFGRIKDTWKQVVTVIQENIPAFQQAFQNLITILTPIFQMLGNIIKNVFGAIVGIIQGAMRTVQGIIQVFSGIIQGDFGLMWQGVKNIFFGAIQMLVSLVKGLVMTIVSIVVGIAKTLWASLSVAFNTIKGPLIALFSSIWNGIKWVVVNAVNGLKIAAIAVFNALKWSISTIFNGIKFIATSVWNGIKWVVVNAVRGLKTIAIATFNILKAGITAIFNGIKFVATSVWNGIKWVVVNAAKGLKNIALATFRLLKAGVTAVWNGIKLATSTVWNWIKNTVIRLATTLRNTALAVFRAFRSGLKAIWNTMKSVASATWNWIKNKVIALARTLRSTAIAVFNALKNGINAIWSAIKSAASATWNWIKNKILALARALRSTAIAIFNALKNGINAIWNAIKGAASRTWNWIKNKVIALARTLRNTVVNVFNAFKNTISNIWNAIKDFTSRLWNGLKNTVVDLATGLKNTVVSRFNSLKNAVSGIWNKIKNTAVDLWQGIKDKITGFATGIKDGVTGTFSKMADVLKGTIDKIKGFVQDMVGKVKGGLNKLIDGVNWVGDKLGMGEIGHVKMHTGTSSSGSVTRNGKLNKDVMATVGDKGKGNGPGGFRHETVIPPKGKPFITPNRDTLMPATKGTAIMNGAQTHAMLSGGTHAFAKGTGWGNKIADFGKGGMDKAHDLGKATMMAGEEVGKNTVDKTKDLANAAKGVAGKGADWLGKKVGDVMDYVKNPGKLLEHILKAFGVNFDGLGKDNIPADMMGGMFKKLKDAAKNKLKEWLEDAEGGDGDAAWLFKHDIWQKFGAYTGGLGFNGGQHFGVDFGMLPGTDVKAVAGGKVSKVWNDFGGGKSMEIDLGNGLTNWYMHLSEQLKKKGDTVGVGDLIAKSGNTGNFTAGSGHLHFQLNKNGKPQSNVLEWLKGLGGGKNKKASAWSSDIKKAAKKMNVKLQGNDLKNIISLINAESSGNAGATQSGVNDINSQRGNPAQGLLQYIPKTFKNYATKGHGNIKSGYDQLLAFFNNKSWRSQFNPNGGWSPSGANRGYANGGIINAPEMAWLAEGGFSESVISHDPRQRMRSKALHDKTGQMLGIDTDTQLLQEIANLLEFNNDLSIEGNRNTKDIANKDTNVYIDEKGITRMVNNNQGNMYNNNLYNKGMRSR